MNAAEILAHEFPENASIGDICDCGHCKRRQPKKCNNHFPKSKGAPFGETDYMSTFQAVEKPRPRSSKKPPRSPGVRERAPYQMNFGTNQRDEFRDPKVNGRTKMIVPEENYEPSSKPMETKTSYTNEFMAKTMPNELKRYAEPRSHHIVSDAKFDDHTTAKEHFKKWVPEPSLTFGELPCFTGSILYPENNKMPQSITKSSFKGEFGRRPDAIRFEENNMGNDGEHDMRTTHNETYTKARNPQRAVQIVNQPTLKVSRTFGGFESQTQNRRDFGEFRNGFPSKVKPIAPAPETIDLRFDNKQGFSTEQRSTYKGHDIRVNPMVKPIRHDDVAYTAPTEKFETMTSNKRDYVPLDVPPNYVRRASLPGPLYVANEIKFDDTTSSNTFFKNWGPQKQRVRYGDFHENQRVEPVGKFEGQSVTKNCYVPKKLTKTQDFKPEHRAIHREGEHDFGTVYKNTYAKPKVKPCRGQIFLAQQELKRQQNLGRVMSH